jgi:C-terminal processing protease CtpA/Prc
MVAFVLSYLFDEPTHLNDLYDRHEDKTTQYWTTSYVPGTRLAKIPVFVLTSHRTFSGAEEFTYDLKNLKRATIVGEVTGGGAHPVGGHRIDDHFEIGVPFARAINPISKTDWEGTGVQPDVAAPAGEALEKAQKLAEARLAEPKPETKPESKPEEKPATQPATSHDKH